MYLQYLNFLVWLHIRWFVAEKPAVTGCKATNDIMKPFREQKLLKPVYQFKGVMTPTIIAIHLMLGLIRMRTSSFETDAAIENHPSLYTVNGYWGRGPVGISGCCTLYNVFAGIPNIKLTNMQSQSTIQGPNLWITSSTGVSLRLYTDTLTTKSFTKKAY